MHVPQNNRFEFAVWNQKRFDKHGFEKAMNMEITSAFEKTLTTESFLLTIGDRGSVIASNVLHSRNDLVHAASPDIVKSESASDNITSIPKPPIPSKFEAWEFAKQFVTARLKSPSTAKFGDGIFDRQQSADKNVSVLQDGTFIVNLWVDSQNSFGAIMRTDCTLKLLCTDNNWVLVDISMTQR